MHAGLAQVGALNFGVSPAWSGAIDYSLALSAGLLAGQFDCGYMAERSVNASTNDDIDLNGVLTDALGQVLSPTKLVALMIVNKPKAGTPANTSNLTVGGAANPVLILGGTTPTFSALKPGDALMLASVDLAGICTITAATGDLLRVANGAGGVAKYQIAIFGRTA